MKRSAQLVPFVLALAFAAAVAASASGAGKPAAPAAGGLTVDDARAFMDETEKELLRLWIAGQRASWVKSTYITDDTESIEAAANEAIMAYTARRATEAVRYEKLPLPPDLRRKILLLKLSLSLPAPSDAAKRGELARIASELEGMYGKGKYCLKHKMGKFAAGTCLTLDDLSEILAKDRSYDDQLEVWTGWHAVAPPMRDDFTKMVALANEGAKELRFGDVSDIWKSRYDMPPAAFEKEVDRLWDQVRPLYEDLHCYVRSKLGATYGADKVAADGPIPAHLFGNMWAQEWSNLSDMLLPKKGAAVDLDKALKAKKVDAVGMVKYGEAFFVSLGLDPLPKTFWERSMFLKPHDRDVVCHASAWDIDYDDDVRIKMCIKITGEDFATIHHELGHNYYQHYYRTLPPLFRDSANDGFHEGLGDTIALSVTPAYLAKVGLIAKVPPTDDVGLLLNRALSKVAFLPFGMLMDKWRWEVFDGRVAPGDYNKRWWELRLKYQGVAPPMARSEADFDPGAKYHIAASVPYARYFLAAILQYQLHRALCKVAGHTGPLHTCSIYGNKEAGERLRKLMEMGLSRPWPEVLEAATGEKAMDATAILDYYAPLHAWLKEQNKGRKCGW
jgi:peptidyl-dipeptidase A